MAIQNLGRVGIVLKGAWSGTTSYVPLDLVSYDGNSWVAKRNNTNVEPNTTNTSDWQLISNNSSLISTVQGYKNDAADSATAAAASATAAAASAVDGASSKAAIASDYSASATYKQGDYAWYSGTLYRAKQDISTAESWTSSHWETAILGNNLAEVERVLPMAREYAMVGGHRITASEIESGGWAYSNKADNSKRLRNKELYPVFAGMAVRYTNPTLQIGICILQTKTSGSYVQNSGWISAGGSGTYTIDYDGYMVFMCQSANDITASDYDCTVEILSAESAALGSGLSTMANDSSAYAVTDQINISGQGIYNNGSQMTYPDWSCSWFIPIYMGWKATYSGMKITDIYNVFSFYGPDKKFVSGVAGQGAATGVSGTFTAPYDGYIRLCVRTDKKADASVTITPTLAARLAGMESLLGNADAVFSNTSGPVEQQISVSSSALNSSGAVFSDSAYSRSAFIHVPAGFFVKYSGLRGSDTYALLCYYTDKDQSTFSSAVMGQGASTPVSGYFNVSAGGYIRLSTRTANLSEAKVTLVAPFSSGQTITKYVSPSGNNNNTGDSAGNAYATIAKALAMGANVIYLAAGNYTETVYAVDVQVKIIGQGAAKFVPTAIANTIEFRNSVVELENITVDMSAISSQYSDTGIFVRDCIARLTNCKVLNSPYMGFRFDGSYAIVTHCVANGAYVDGFNGHDTTNNTSEAFFIGCVAKNCGDDGLSFHEEGKIHVLGGEYANCASTGIAPHNNCNCDIRDAYVHHNGRAGIEALVGSYTIPNPLPTMILSGCMFEGNTGNAVTAEHYIVKASANGASGNGANSIVNGGGSTIATEPLIASGGGTLEGNIGALQTELVSVEKMSATSVDFGWLQSTDIWSTDGSNRDNRPTRSRSGYITLLKGAQLTIRPGVWYVQWYRYKMDGTWVDRSDFNAAWTNENFTLSFSDSDYKMRFVVRAADADANVTASDVNVTGSMTAPIIAKINSLSTGQLSPQFVLPRRLYICGGKQMNLYYANMVKNIDKLYDMMATAFVSVYDYFARIDSTATTNTQHSLYFQAYPHNAKQVIWSGIFGYTVVPTTSGTGLNKKIMLIGDSITRQIAMSGFLSDDFDGDPMAVTFVGTYKDNENTDYHEGRPGWSAYNYVHDATHTSDSGSTLTNYFYNPDTQTFDFAYYANTKYQEVTGNAFPGVDYVFVNLGTNDFGRDPSAIVNDLKAIVNSIHSYDANIRVGVWTLPPRALVGIGSLVNRDTILDIAAAVIAEFDQKESAKTYLVPMTLTLDPYYDFQIENQAVSSRNSATWRVATDKVHPADPGRWKIADMFYSYIKYFGSLDAT